MTVEGRFVGRFYEWPCATCGCVLQAEQAPSDPQQECCLGCRIGKELETTERLVSLLSAEAFRLSAEVRRLEKQHLEDLDVIHELREMVNRAHTEDREDFADGYALDAANDSNGEVA